MKQHRGLAVQRGMMLGHGGPAPHQCSSVSIRGWILCCSGYPARMFLCIGATPAAQRVMVFGSLRLDSVNRAHTTLDGAAGKSINVAKVLRSLGEKPVALGFAGGPRGEEILRALQSKGIELDFVTVDAPTRQCITVIDEASGAVTELVEESRPVAPEDYGRLFEVIRRHLPHAQAVLLSGTLTPGAPADLYRKCVEAAHAAGAISIVDAKGPALLEALEAQPGVVKPNRAELAATVGHDVGSEPALLAAMRDLHQRGAQRVVVTAGKEATFAYDGNAAWRIAPPEIRPVNPIGSGDAFTAALTWRLAQGDELGEACRWGTAAGAANALTLMPGELALEEVHRLAHKVEIQRINA